MAKHRKPVPISEQDMIAFMRERKINASCPRCPTTSWRVIESEEGRGAGWQMYTSDGKLSLSVLPVVPLVCQNCGYVWPIARQVIEDWMGERADA